MGQEVLKLSPAGMVMMVIGKQGVSGNGSDTFDRPTGVAVARNGDIFVADGHYPNKHNNVPHREMFDKNGKFIKAWGKVGAERRAISENPTTSASAAANSMGVRRRPPENRIQVFDQDGKFITAWLQFGQPSSVYVDKNDNIFVGSIFQDPTAPQGQLRGIVIGSVKDGSLKAFIPTRPIWTR